MSDECPKALIVHTGLWAGTVSVRNYSSSRWSKEIILRKFWSRLGENQSEKNEPRTYTYTNTCIHPDMCAYTHIYTHVCAYINTYTRVCKHTHLHRFSVWRMAAGLGGQTDRCLHCSPTGETEEGWAVCFCRLLSVHASTRSWQPGFSGPASLHFLPRPLFSPLETP